MNAALRDLPAVHRLLSEPEVSAYANLLGPATVKAAVTEALRDARARAVRDGIAPDAAAVAAHAVRLLARDEAASLLPVLNATGIVVHTNLGRAPLADEALAAIDAVARGYANLEYDLVDGVRGSRHERVGALLRDATGAEDGLVVNNCAAAVLLVLDTFAKGREVVVARNQLIEIGGGFRLPDVLARSGATLVEVGATNKVRLDDVARALSPRTALVLRGHPSNFRIEGFTEDVEPSALAAFARRAGITVVEDLGSGALVDLRAYGLPHERTVQEAVADGIDLVAFSGDKLLGGPQAGVVVGRRGAVARLRANPLLRALRVDKATLAALAATLRLYLEPGGAARIPVHAMLGASLDDVRRRAERVCDAVAAAARDAGARVGVIETEAFAGGGSLPGAVLPSAALSVTPRDRAPNALAARLRGLRPPVVARVHGDAVLVDLRAIAPADDAVVATAVQRALR